jgi:hypothetical protein
MQLSGLSSKMSLLLREVQQLHLLLLQFHQRQSLIIEQRANVHQVDQQDIQQTKEIMANAAKCLELVNCLEQRYLEWLDKYQENQHQQYKQQHYQRHQKHLQSIQQALELFEQCRYQHRNCIQGNQHLFQSSQFVLQLCGYILLLLPQIGDLLLLLQQQTHGQGIQLHVQQTEEYIKQLHQQFSQSLQLEEKRIKSDIQTFRQHIEQGNMQQHRITQQSVPYISPTSAQGNPYIYT